MWRAMAVPVVCLFAYIWPKTSLERETSLLLQEGPRLLTLVAAILSEAPAAAILYEDGLLTSSSCLITAVACSKLLVLVR